VAQGTDTSLAKLLFTQVERRGVRLPTTPCLIFPGSVVAGGEGNGYFGSVGRRFDSCSRESGIAQWKSSRQRKLEP